VAQQQQQQHAWPAAGIGAESLWLRSLWCTRNPCPVLPQTHGAAAGSWCGFRTLRQQGVLLTGGESLCWQEFGQQPATSPGSVIWQAQDDGRSRGTLRWTTGFLAATHIRGCFERPGGSALAVFLGCRRAAAEESHQLPLDGRERERLMGQTCPGFEGLRQWPIKTARIRQPDQSYSSQNDTSHFSGFAGAVRDARTEVILLSLWERQNLSGS